MSVDRIGGDSTDEEDGAEDAIDPDAICAVYDPTTKVYSRFNRDGLLEQLPSLEKSQDDPELSLWRAQFATGFTRCYASRHGVFSTLSSSAPVSSEIPIEPSFGNKDAPEKEHSSHEEYLHSESDYFPYATEASTAVPSRQGRRGGRYDVDLDDGCSTSLTSSEHRKPRGRRRSRSRSESEQIENHELKRGRVMYLVRQPAGNLAWKEEAAAKQTAIADYWKALGQPRPLPAVQSQHTVEEKAPRSRGRRVKCCDTPACFRDGKPFFYVEKLLDKKEEEGITYYFVKWIGYDDPADNSWEPEENLDCPQVVHAFNAAREQGLLT